MEIIFVISDNSGLQQRYHGELYPIVKHPLNIVHEWQQNSLIQQRHAQIFSQGLWDNHENAFAVIENGLNSGVVSECLGHRNVGCGSWPDLLLTMCHIHNPPNTTVFLLCNAMCLPGSQSSWGSTLTYPLLPTIMRSGNFIAKSIIYQKENPPF